MQKAKTDVVRMTALAAALAAAAGAAHANPGNVERWFIDPTAVSSYCWGGNAPGAAGCIEVSTTALMAGPTTFVLAGYAAPVYVDVSTYARNVTIAQYDLATGTNSIGGLYVVEGIDQYGKPVTESLQINTSGLTTVGSVCYHRVFRVTVRCTTLRGGTHGLGKMAFHIGVGSKLGLGYDVRTNDDIVMVYENYTPKLTGYTIDYGADSITFGLAPNGSRDYLVFLRGRK